MTVRENTVSKGWREFYSPYKTLSRLRKKLVITSMLSFAFIVMVMGSAHFFLNAKTTQPLIKEHTAANLFKANFVYTPEITTKLKTANKNQSILRARFSLEIASHEEKAKVNQKMHLIANQLRKKLGAYAAHDLKKTKGIEAVRKELLSNVNKIMNPIKINRVFIKDFIIH